MCDGAVAGFKYFDLTNTKKIRVNAKGKAEGLLYIGTEEDGAPAAKVEIKPTRNAHGFVTELNAPGKKQPLFFKFQGKGSFDFLSFELR